MPVARLAAAALLLAGFGTGSLTAQVLTSEQVIDLKQVTSVSMHPYGDYVAYTLRVPRGADEDPGGTYTEIWVLSTRDGETRRYTSKPVSAFDVGWSADGGMITFRSRRESHDPNTQVWAIMLGGGEAERLSQAPRSPSVRVTTRRWWTPGTPSRGCTWRTSQAVSGIW
jgi:Tol biopolymer transport system component